MNCFYFLLLIFEIYISKLKFYLIHYFFRMIFIFSFSGPFSTSCFSSKKSSSSSTSWRRRRRRISCRLVPTKTLTYLTLGETIIFSILCHLLCLVAVLAPLGLYINSKQQHWCTKCIHFKLIFILIPILPDITKLIMTSWLSEKCERVGREES